MGCHGCCDCRCAHTQSTLGKPRQHVSPPLGDSIFSGRSCPAAILRLRRTRTRTDTINHLVISGSAGNHRQNAQGPRACLSSYHAGWSRLPALPRLMQLAGGACCGVALVEPSNQDGLKHQITVDECGLISAQDLCGALTHRSVLLSFIASRCKQVVEPVLGHGRQGLVDRQSGGLGRALFPSTRTYLTYLGC